jgi:hypothetical protein
MNKRSELRRFHTQTPKLRDYDSAQIIYFILQSNTIIMNLTINVEGIVLLRPAGIHPRNQMDQQCTHYVLAFEMQRSSLAEDNVQHVLIPMSIHDRICDTACRASFWWPVLALRHAQAPLLGTGCRASLPALHRRKFEYGHGKMACLRDPTTRYPNQVACRKRHHCLQPR